MQCVSLFRAWVKATVACVFPLAAYEPKDISPSLV